MLRTVFRSSLVILAFLGGISAAQAEEPIERSGNSYHRAVCERNIAPEEARCMAHMRVDARGNPFDGKPNAASPNVTPSGYAPSQLRTAYGVTATGSATTIVAIVDAYGYPNAESDLAVYRTQYGLPPCTTANGCFIKISQNGNSNYPKYNSGWAQEQALDLDMASAMCPNCKIMLVQASTASYANLATAVNMAISRGAKVVSNSYGGSETGSTSYNSAFTHPGIAITASTGDSGYGVSWPASSPGVIAVGGTTLIPAATSRGYSETAWAKGGSGCSTVYAKPVWQNDPLCAGKRMEADISAVGDPATGVAVYGPVVGTASGWLVFGGTSVSAPLIGGIYGSLGLGAANGAAKLWNSAPNGLTDITSGSNGSCGGTYFCTAQPGYDGPTGLGTPYGAAAF